MMAVDGSLNTPTDSQLAWAWVLACCVSVWGPRRGAIIAKSVPMRVAAPLWHRAWHQAGEA